MKKRGRPFSTDHRKTINISGHENELRLLKEYAKKAGKSVSAYVLECCNVKMRKSAEKPPVEV